MQDFHFFYENQIYYTYFDNGTAVVGNISQLLHTEPTAVDNSSVVNGANIKIPENITVNDENYTVISLFPFAFFKCEINNIELPDTLKYIGRSALDLTHIKNTIILPESLESIGDWGIATAWFTSINIPSNLTHIGNGAIGCNRYLTDIEISEDQPYFTFKTGILYDHSLTTIIQAVTSIESASIPKSVKIIQAAAFSHSNLKELIIPTSVKIINQQIIDSCQYLKKLYILGNPIFPIGNDKGIGATYDQNLALDLFYYQGSKIITHDIFLYLKVETLLVCNGYESKKFGNYEVTKDIHCQAISLPLTCAISFKIRSFNFLYVTILLS